MSSDFFGTVSDWRTQASDAMTQSFLGPSEAHAHQVVVVVVAAALLTQIH
jgi:hypothetical protein